MSMTMRISHRTGFRYEGNVRASYNEARMTPVTSPGQLVLSTRMDVTPSPWAYRYRDYWGCQVTAFEVHEPHQELLLEATSQVQVSRRAPRPAGLGWDDIRRDSVADQFCEFLEVSRRVQPGEELRERAAELAGAASGPTDLAHAVCGLVHDEMTYMVGSTQVHGTAQEAWAERKGVCQDFAHLCLGVLRAHGVPARYVSGYLHPSKSPEPDVEVTGESHAWIEWWDGTWVGFDPTNQVVPDDRYVVIGAGRDYADVSPLTGIFSGGSTSSMFVTVTLTRTG